MGNASECECNLSSTGTPRAMNSPKAAETQYDESGKRCTTNVGGRADKLVDHDGSRRVSGRSAGPGTNLVEKKHSGFRADLARRRRRFGAASENERPPAAPSPSHGGDLDPRDHGAVLASRGLGTTRSRVRSSWFEIPDLDKVVHCAIFVIFAILWARVWSSRRRFAWVALGGFVLAVVTELVQLLPVVGRDGEIGDVLTDAAGVLIGIAIAPLVEPLARFLECRVFPEATARPVPAESAAAPEAGR